MKYIKFLLILVISVHLLYLSIRKIDSYPNGDGPEYALMTEAFYNHFSPDIRVSDVESFKNSSIKFRPWDKVGKYYEFNVYHEFLLRPVHNFKDFDKGIYTAKNGKHYFYHFYAYSLLCLPIRAIAEINNFPPLRSFQVTNAILIIITCTILLFYTNYKPWLSIIVCISFLFSSVYWYLGWPSPEVYTICLTTIAFWLYFQGKRFVPLFLLSLATLQNQPIAILSIFISISILIERGITLRTLKNLFLCNMLVLVPPSFYFYHFDTMNLIKDSGILSWDVVTWQRIRGFYTDLNQGIILSIPVILILYPILWLKNIYRSIHLKRLDYHLILPFFILAMVTVFCTMINWNHGMAVINRYATWTGSILMIHFFYLVKDIKFRNQILLLLPSTIIQTSSVLYNNKHYNHLDWDQNLNKPWAKWMYETFPSFYNPDPNIFFVRTSRNYNFIPEESPVVYIDKSGYICKILVHKDHVENLEKWGISIEQQHKMSESLNFINGWAYINKGEFTTSLNPEEINSKKMEERIRIIMLDMERQKDWYNSIKEKAVQNNLTIKEMMRLDAIYLYNLENN